MAKEAVGKALKDAKLTYDKVEQATVGYVYGKCYRSSYILSRQFREAVILRGVLSWMISEDDFRISILSLL